MEPTPLRYAQLVLAAGAVSLAAALPASADRPTIPAKKAEARRVLAEVQVLDVRLEQSVEAYNLARIRLAETERGLKANGEHLALARRNLRRAQSQLAARVIELYTQDELAPTLAVVLGARRLGDLLDHHDVARRVAEQDTLVLREVRRFKTEVAGRQRRLELARAERSRLVAELARRRASIEARLAERERRLASVKTEITRLEAEERARQERLRREAQARLAAERRAREAAQEQDPAPEPVLGVAAVTPEGASVAPATRHAHVVEIAMRYLGVPYRWGGASPEEGFDCSGFVLYVYAQVGVSLPHNAAMQYGYGVPVSRDDLQPGDIVFFNNLGHNGIYIGGGQFIQAPRTGDVVKISSLSEPWYASGYVGARRLP